MLGAMSTKPVITVSMKTSVLDAARLMRKNNVGAVVVVNGSKPKGVLTDRDIAVSVVAEGLDPDTTLVGDVMRGHPAVIREDRGVLDAVKAFSEHGVRRLPVIDKHGKLAGIVALDDLLMLFGMEMGHVAAAVSKELGRTNVSVS